MSKTSDKGGAKIDAREFAASVSPSKAQYAALIEAYKLQNPKKYELKKAALEAKLNAME